MSQHDFHFYQLHLGSPVGQLISPRSTFFASGTSSHLPSCEFGSKVSTYENPKSHQGSGSLTLDVVRSITQGGFHPVIRFPRSKCPYFQEVIGWIRLLKIIESQLNYLLKTYWNVWKTRWWHGLKPWRNSRLMQLKETTKRIQEKQGHRDNFFPMVHSCKAMMMKMCRDFIMRIHH